MEFGLWKPPADVLHLGERWFIKLEVAGVCPEEVEIVVHRNTLRIRGCRRDMLLEEGYFYHSLEISYSRFERIVELPFTIATDSIRWEYREGMLLIQLQKEDAS
ncbi:Hsp20/alpha crystallin family protein [Proteobacteria bacterium 005FR1]|nr:Hsp20/alpha crystallin family protein [Proteobacteria bacterium 005FR1]